MSKKQTISIYLLRNGISPEDSITGITKLNNYNLIDGAKYYPKTNELKKPDWAEYLELKEKELETRSVSCILFIPFNPSNNNNQRWAALVFGRAHGLLGKESVVNDFGKRVGLNMLDENKLRSSDIFEPSDYAKKKRIQTIRGANLRFLEFKRHQNLLRSATGFSVSDYNHQGWGHSVTFTESYIKIQMNIDISSIKKEIEKVHEIYEKTDYEKKFPEVFDLKPIKQPEKVKELWLNLINRIQNRDENLYIDFPDIINYNESIMFKITKDFKEFDPVDNLHIDYFYSFLDRYEMNIKTVEDLKKIKIDYLSEEGNPVNRKRVYDCLSLDTDYDGHGYCLYDTEWYQLNNDFRNILKSAMQKHKRDYIVKGKTIPEYDPDNHEEGKDYATEYSFNTDLSEKIGGTLLDRENLHLKLHGKIELCDIFLKEDKDTYVFVHAKRMKSGSSSLSHLFYQGITSLTLLNKKDMELMNKIKNKGIMKNLGLNRKKKYDKKVHFLIIRKNKTDNLPLFAQISLHSAIETILGMGAEVVYSIVGGDIKQPTSESQSNQEPNAK